MKKNILAVLFVSSFLVAGAQNSPSLFENYNTSPCQVAWQQPGAVQGIAGDDIVSDSFNITNGTLELTSVINPQSTPYFYALTNSVVSNCGNELGKGAVDVSGNGEIWIKAKASANTTVQVYIQEGNTPSLDLSKCSSSILKLNLTTNYQVFTLSNFSATSFVSNQPDIDLTNVGMLVFEAKDGNNNVDFDGKIMLDYLCLSQHCLWEISQGTNELTQNLVSVFPSPAQDEIKVQFTSFEAATVTITDMSGRIVSTEAISAGTTSKSFDVSKLESGIYMLQLISSEGMGVSKFVVE
jgi:hypothetical protein